MMEIMATNDYSGINEMEHFKDATGKVLSLIANDIRWDDGVSYSAAGDQAEQLALVEYEAPNEHGPEPPTACDQEEHLALVEYQTTLEHDTESPAARDQEDQLALEDGAPNEQGTEPPPKVLFADDCKLNPTCTSVSYTHLTLPTILLV